MLSGTIRVPGDKSITHRALILSSFCRGSIQVVNASPSADCRSTIECLERLGIKIRAEERQAGLIVDSPGISSLLQPEDDLYCGNSGTSMRLLAGLVAGSSLSCRFDGDASLRGRTMRRVFEPLARMGAIIKAEQDDYAPFTIEGGGLRGDRFELAVASAQVQTCILLAGLQADGETEVVVSRTVRDHTRRMFDFMHVPYRSEREGSISVTRLPEPLEPCTITVPSDLSSAAFFMVAAALVLGSRVTLPGVGINPGRDLAVDVLLRMGADIEIANERLVCNEPVADITVAYSGRLKGVEIEPYTVASGIDELPILALAGAMCNGEMIVRGAGELRHKESDRIKTLVGNLRENGVSVEEFDDGFRIEGADTVGGGGEWSTKGDHRMAMTGAVASLVFSRPVKIDNLSCADVSYPGFESALMSVLAV